jgi:hypothetical protein
VHGEYIETGTLSEPEWMFVFERVGAVGRKVKNDKEELRRVEQAKSSFPSMPKLQRKGTDRWIEILTAAEQGDRARVEQLRARIADENISSELEAQIQAKSVTPEPEYILDLRYGTIICSFV